MASLMENLIHVLEDECKVYDELLELSIRKTPVIIKGDLEQLEKITDEEQEIVSKINHLDNQREEVLKDIAIVINKDVETLKLKKLIQVLENRPEEQRKLSTCHDQISKTLEDLKRVNDQNNVLIQNALDMVTFDINLVQALNSAPETANYTKNANRTAGNMYQDPYASGGFDAKQ